MKRPHSISLFWKYLSLYLTMLLLTCVLLGTIFSSTYIHTINNRSEQTIKNQADQAIADLERQLSAMRLLSLKLSVQRIFSTDYYLSAKTNEIELLDALAQYKPYAELATEYALMYRVEDRIDVFRSQGGKADIEVFLEHYRIPFSDELNELLFGSDSSVRTTLYPGVLLIAYPVKASAHHAENGVLCFILETSAIKERIELVSDLPTDEYALSFQDRTVFSTDLSKHTVYSGDELSFSIVASVPVASLYEVMFSRRDLWLIVLSIIMLITCIIMFAQNSVSPWQTLIRRLSPETPSPSVFRENEIAILEHLLLQVQNRSSELCEQGERQKKLLQNYLLLMLFNNGYSDNKLADYVQWGLDLSAPLYCVVAIRPLSNQIIQQRSIDIVLNDLSSLADEIGGIYSVECDNTSHTIAALLNICAQEQVTLFSQRLRLYLGQQHMGFTIGIGQVVDMLYGIPSSYLSAIDSLQNSVPGHRLNGASGESRDTTSIQDTLSRFIGHLEVGNCQDALLELNNYLDLFAANASMVLRKYNVFSLSSAVQQFCQKHHLPLSKEQMSLLLSMNDDEGSIYYTLLRLVPVLCVHMQEKSNSAVHSASKLVMDYVQSAFCDYNISAKSIAEAVGLGINRTNAIIKNETDMTCKAYITHLRIEKAKRLLNDTNLSLAEIAERIGYGNASYFIQVFKASTQLTPDAYRRRGPSNHPENNDAPARNA